MSGKTSLSETCLQLSDINEGFRKAIGLTAVVLSTDGEEWELDTDVDSVDSDVALASIHIELSKLRSELNRVDAEYRAWRAVTCNDLLDVDPKLSEWKAKSKVEASPGFTAYKEHQSQLATAISTLEGFAEAIRSR